MSPRLSAAGLGRLSLTRQVALLSLIPIIALGVILARVLHSQIDARVRADATETARLIATLGIEPRLDAADLTRGLAPAQIAALDRQLATRAVIGDLARIKIWNTADTVIYSEDHTLIGRRLQPSDDLEAALAGRPEEAKVVEGHANSETAGEVGLGKLVEVYVPLRFSAKGAPAGAFEVYLSYRPIAAAVMRDKRTIALLVAIGLALLWAIVFRIVARASRRLRRQSQENLRLARYDSLTQLPNRMMFLEHVARAMRRARANDGSIAVLVLDLDRFGEANNTLGSAIGDQILQEVAERLRGSLGDGTLLARLGADEYGVLCGRAQCAQDAQAMAVRAQDSLLEPITVAGTSVNVEVSIGMAVLEPDDTAEAILQRADTALARAAASARRIHLYDPARDSVDARQLILLGEVRGAIEREEFVLHYQPKIDLSSRRMTGVEALVRWAHPERGLLAPARFVPLIEQTALVGPLTLYVIEHALRQMVRWRRVGVNVQMAVNLSARNLLDRELPARIGGLLSAHGVSAEMLTVEVTESAAMADPSRAVAVLEAIRAMGVRVSVDDFGTGNASIEYLAALPAHELKIDRSFITGVLDDPRLEAIVRATVDLARNLDLTVVAEGIESAEVLEHVAALGCDEAQGYCISRPCDPDDLQRLLSEAFGVGAEKARSSRRGSRSIAATVVSG
ncbi:MAG TPA: bifunctional diguanylate cyclase/phosphodiesterase [Solirubrobacteraceae bacterium]|nr:bifunctional diguanylate cyclase/phosphodiesterase [Solirubrobacteraceae bacterium]